MSLRIYITSIFVSDQDQALDFYTNLLGFEVKENIPLGEYRWLTLTAKGDSDGTQLMLEPSAHPAVGPYREALAKDGIPAASFAVDDLDEECERLRGLGVRFTQEPMTVDGIKMAVLDDTCGNLVQIIEIKTEQ